MAGISIFETHHRKGILPAESSALGLSLLPVIVTGRSLAVELKIQVGSALDGRPQAGYGVRKHPIWQDAIITRTSKAPGFYGEPRIRFI